MTMNQSSNLEIEVTLEPAPNLPFEEFSSRTKRPSQQEPKSDLEDAQRER